MSTKVCSCCKARKSTKKFYKELYGKNGLRSKCILCMKKYNVSHKKERKLYFIKYACKNKKRLIKYRKNYYKQHKAKIAKRSKIYRTLRRIIYKRYYRKYYINNKKFLNYNNKKYYLKNKEKILEICKKYREKFKLEYKRYNKKYRKLHKREINSKRKIRLANDMSFKIKCNLRCRLYKVLKGRIKSSTVYILIGCSIEKLKQHLQSQFKLGMNWSNYGTGHNGKGMQQWHIDHIRPCASFDLTKESEQKKCFHYTNLQPLWAEINLRKKDKINETR
jgi:hypothetical protein